MGLNSRYQRKSMEQAQGALGPEVKVLDHGVGYAGPHPFLTAAGILVALLLLLLVTGRPLGGLLIIALGYTINKPRGVVLTDRGVTVFRRSMIMSKLSAPAGTYPVALLAAEKLPAQLGFVRILLGSERVWMRAKDLDRMTSAAPA